MSSKKKKSRKKEERTPDAVPGKTFAERAKSFCLSHRVEFILFFVSAVVSSFIVFSTTPDPYPAGSDASFYVNGAENLIRILKNFPEFCVKFLADSYSRIDYIRMGLVDPSGINTFFRAPSYSTFLALQFMIFGKSPVTILLFQVIMLSMIYLLIYQIVSSCGSRRASVGAAIAAMFYYSFYLCASKSDTEIFLTFLVLAACKLFVAVLAKPTRLKIFLLGFVFFVLTGTKSSMQYLVLPLLLIFAGMYLYMHRKKWRMALLPLALGLLIPSLLLATFYTRSNGKVGMVETGIAGVNLYHGQTFFADGFSPHPFFQNKWYVEEARRTANSFDQRMWYAHHNNVCMTAFKNSLSEEWGRIILYAIKKSSYLLMHVPNNGAPRLEKFAFLQGMSCQFYHRLFLLFSVLSFVLLKRNNLEKTFFFVLFAYHIGIYSFALMDTRYFMPLVPFYFIFSALYAGSVKSFWRDRRFKLLAACSAAVIILFFTGMPSFGLDYIFANAFKIFLFNLAFAFLLFVLIKRIMKGVSMDHRVAGILVCIYFLLAANINLFLDKKVLASSVTGKNYVEQTIAARELAGNLYGEKYLMFDSREDFSGVRITINGKALQSSSIMKGSPVLYAKELEFSEKEPRWSFIRIPDGYLSETNVVRFESPDGIPMRADYMSSRISYLPSHIYNIANYGVLYGYQKAERSDRRIFMEQNLKSSLNTTSLDGRPTGKRARIYILARRHGGYYMHKRYTQLLKALPSYLTLVRLVDRGVVRYKVQPAPDEVMISGNIANVLAGDMENFRSEYDLF